MVTTFTSAPSLTPSILGVTAVSWSITLWIKCPGGTTVGTGQVTNVILGIMNAEMTNGTFNTNMAWALQGYSTNAIAFTKGTTGGGNNVFSVLTPPTGPNIVRDDTWKMVTIHIPQVGITGAIYVNNESVPAVTDVHSAQSASLPGQFLCIGAYSQPMTYLARDYQLGKIAFHDHMLNQTERSLLYESVVP